MRFRAVLIIKDAGNNVIRKFRIMNESGETVDVSIEKVRQALSKGEIIENLNYNNGKIETTEILNIPELRKNSISLYDWCMQNGERGQRIFKEFTDGENFPLTARDLSFRSAYKAKFRCTVCHKINIQTIYHKTGKTDNKCKYCSNRAQETSLLEWCNNHDIYGAQLLQEFIAGDNEFTPDQVPYSSKRYANFKCSKCGSVNNQVIASKTRKDPRGCKYCNTHRTSLGEQLIFLWIQSQGLEVYNQYRFQTPLGTKEFDIYLPQLNLVIEHQSNRHATTERQFCDDTTELIAQELELKLLEVCLTNTNYQRQESNWCITYKQNHEQEMINKLSSWLNINYGLNTNPNYQRALEDQAYLNSCKVTYEQSIQFKNPPFLKEWNYELNGFVTPDKVSINSNRKYYWTCNICGNIYLAPPIYRYHRYGCPNHKNKK